MLAICLAAAHDAPAAAAAELFRIDPAATRAEFAVDHFWVSTLRGTFGRTHGTIVLDGQARTGSIDFVVDAASVDTGWSVRDDFIRGERMFDAARFPEVRFRSTELAFDATGLAGASGDAGARIFCSRLEAELVSIAGRYLVSEQLPPEQHGSPVQIALVDDRLTITRN